MVMEQWILDWIVKVGFPAVIVLLLLFRIEPALRRLEDNVVTQIGTGHDKLAAQISNSQDRLADAIRENSRATADMAKAVTELSTIIHMLRNVNGGNSGRT